MTELSEMERLAVLHRLAVLDTGPDAAFDALTSAAARAFHTQTALVSLVDETRQWFKSRVGLDAHETPRSPAFCAHAIQSPDVMVVADARADPRFRGNPLVTGEPFIRFYAGAPLTVDGARVGTLCLLDPEPRHEFEDAQRSSLAAMASVVEELLRLRGELNERRVLMSHVETQARTLALAESLAGVGHWSLDLSTDRLEWSREVYRIHGVEPGAFQPNLNTALQFYEGESRALVDRSLDETLTTGAPFAFKAAVRRASDGAYRRVFARGELHTDDSGCPRRLFGVFQDITDQEISLESVTRDRERYRLLADNATDVIATYTPEGEFTFLSPSIERLVGRSAADLIGRKTYELIHADDHAVVTQRFRALLKENRESTRIEYRALRSDGESVWVEAHPSPMYGAHGELIGFQDVVRDISARKRAEDQARIAAEHARIAVEAADASELRYRRLAENANDMMASMAPDSTVLFVSPACRRVLGYEPDELVGRKTLALTHADDLASVQALFAKLIAAGPNGPLIPYQFRALRKDGAWIWLEGQPRVEFDADGAPTRFQDVVRDVTARKDLEAELREERARAERATEVKSEFLANMSHELRTPLTSVIGFSKLLHERDDLTPQTRGYVARVYTGSKALLATVNDILDFSRLEAGQVDISPQPTPARALGAEILSLFILQAQSKSLLLEVATDRSVPDVILVDPDRLRQVLLNLVGNAVKFTSAGGVTVSFGYRADRLRVEVRDTGAGISAEGQGLLFRRFSQVDGSTTRTHGGTGLGLAICKGLVEAMGGALGVRSAENQGATFWFEVPAPAVPASKPGSDRVGRTSPSTATLKERENA